MPLSRPCIRLARLPRDTHRPTILCKVRPKQQVCAATPVACLKKPQVQQLLAWRQRPTSVPPWLTGVCSAADSGGQAGTAARRREAPSDVC